MNSTQPPQDRSIDHLSSSDLDQIGPAPELEPQTVEANNLTEKILQAENGRGLIRFCRELSAIIIRRFMVDQDMEQLRNRLRASLIDTLSCTEAQAESVIDLSLELIHAQVHGKYRRSNVELSYLIAMATGAVRDVEAN